MKQTLMSESESIKALKEKISSLCVENEMLRSENKVLIEKSERLKALNIKKTIEAQDAQLIKYNKELEQFTYVATHDLKSPLANIQGYLELLEIDIENPNSEVLDSIKWLKYSVTEARQVIRELTNALKARNSKEELLAIIHLEDLVESILSGMRSRILNSNIIFICDFTEVNEFKYYPVALRSILQNIISNAIQYSTETEFPEVQVTTHLNSNQEVCITVKDNGVGIDLAANEAKVFGLFKRVNNDESGSGIGMYIVNKLLENYGGKLELTSELGQGSAFMVIIPYKKI